MKTAENVSESSRLGSSVVESCGCGKASGSTHRLDFESIGRSRFLSELQHEARLTLSSLPGSDAMEKLNMPAREFFDHLSEMLLSACSAAKWGESEISAFAVMTETACRH